MRDLSLAESAELVKRHIEEDYTDLLSFKNHKKHHITPNTFRFTVDFISLDFLIGLMEEEGVKNVYFNPSVPPPGGSFDGISMRYKVYIRYHQIEGEE
jgi:hypothetical protein